MRPSTVASGLAAWAERTPDRIAVRDDTGAFTFAELDGLAGTLARQLRERLGDARPTAVPLLVRRDRWAPLAIHAALRAGLAFAPLDAALPPAALASLIDRLGRPPLVVTGVEPAALPEGVAALPVPTEVSDPVPPCDVDLPATAVVVFTSGSTGRPKGVVHDWRSLEARLEQLAADGRGGPETHTAVTAPFHWVAGLGRSYALGAGGTFAIADAALLDPIRLWEWFDATEVNDVSLVPSLAVRMADRWAGARRLERVRCVALGGEAVRWEHVAVVRQLVAPEARVSMQYGASETGGIHVLRFEVGPDDELGEGRVPLGRTDVDGKVWLDPVDDDGLGEIVVRDPGARGYLDEPPAVAARFGEDSDGTRWWRSGDLARVDERGVFWAAGRADEMVKINGRLVEPSEPEDALRTIAGVRDAAVVPYEGDGHVLLVGHVAVDPDAGLTAQAVRTRLRESLPAHLVPRPLVRHERLPHLPGGKVDRAALRRSPPQPWRDAPATPPSDVLEAWLLDEVRAIVGVDDVGIDDDLFAIGLDSLGVVELCGAIADAGHPTISPAQVLEDPTVRGLRERLRQPEHDASTVKVFNAAGSRPPIHALPGGGGTAMKYRDLAQALGPDQPVVVVEPRGLHDRGRPARTVRAFAAHARREIEARVAPGEACVIAGYSASGPVAFEVAQQLVDDGRAVHVLLFDCAPVARVRPQPAPVEPPGPVEVRDASWTALPGAVLRSLRYRVTHFDETWVRWSRRWTRARRAGTRYDAARYETYARIMDRAGRAYRPRPARFPVTVFPVAGSRAAAQCAEHVADLRVLPVGGDHLSMLDYPHVVELAALVTQIVDGMPTTPRPS